jgi:Proteasome assembly chaperone 3
MNGSPGFQVRTKTYAFLSGGLATDVHMTAYEDRVLVVVTQTGSFGTIIDARYTCTCTPVHFVTALILELWYRQESNFEGQPTFSTSVVLGVRDEPLLTLCARSVLEHAHKAGCAK